MNDAWQVLSWCRYFSLTKSQLETTIQAVGTRVVDIELYLASHDIGKVPAPVAKSLVPTRQKGYFH